ncbi:MAG: SAM-dependent chlorinase/fluorinase [Candidatus Hydrogenedentes bacterium]|nr:SAM-dependent chlorinase/fluorinase [Candidatus Hydrogenedentota bacterium]
MSGDARPPLVTLTTDFGTRDPWVAAMKGVIHRINPAARIEDLTHGIGAQNVLEGALFLAGAVPYFPEGVIHVVVVDPGVGSDRKPLIAECAGQTLVLPDNGLLTLLDRRSTVTRAHVIENPAFTLRDPSATFHGRDIFAPAAAHASLGRPLEEFGPEAGDPRRIDIPEPHTDAEGQIHGVIIHLDRFGNCITNIGRDMAPEESDYRVQVAAKTLPRIHRTYGDVPPGALVALFGSSGYLEIAVSMESAARALQLRPGAPVTLYRP